MGAIFISLKDCQKQTDPSKNNNKWKIQIYGDNQRNQKYLNICEPKKNRYNSDK